MRQQRKQIGLAIIGCGTIGRIRAEFARDYPGIGWLGLCDSNAEVGQKLVYDAKADFFTTDYNELLERSEVTAAMIATDDNAHDGPVLAACERKLALFMEKPWAPDARASEKVVKASEEAGIDAVMGSTNRFRRRFQAVKGKISRGELGEVTSVVTRAFMNRMVPIATIRKTNQRQNLTPMVVSGTHALDMSMYLMEGKTPVSVYARSVDKALAMWGTKDSTFGIFTMHDGTLWSMNISWALPQVWPGAVYGLQVGIVGTEGVIDIEDTHRDLVMATEKPIGAGYTSRNYKPDFERHIDFLTSYPARGMNNSQLSGPMREETNSWFGRIHTGLKTPHASAAEGHRNLLLTMAMDLSAKRGTEIKLPLELDELYE